MLNCMSPIHDAQPAFRAPRIRNRLTDLVEKVNTFRDVGSLLRRCFLSRHIHNSRLLLPFIAEKKSRPVGCCPGENSEFAWHRDASQSILIGM